MTPPRSPERRLKRLAAAAVVAGLVLPVRPQAALAQESTEESTSTTESPSPSPSAFKAPTYRLRARVKPSPSADFGALKTFAQAMDRVQEGACQETDDLLLDGKPKRSKVKLRMVREEGTPEDASAKAPGGSCAKKEQRTSGYKLRVKVSYPKPNGDRKISGKVKLGKAFTTLADRMNAMRDKVLTTGKPATFKLKLIRVKKSVPGMIRGLAKRHGLSVTKSLNVAKCESNFNPKAYNPAGPWAGVYQQDTEHWPARAKKYGHSGASVFNAYPNVHVSLQLARDDGWSHWACA